MIDSFGKIECQVETINAQGRLRLYSHNSIYDTFLIIQKIVHIRVAKTNYLNSLFFDIETKFIFQLLAEKNVIMPNTSSVKFKISWSKISNKFR